MKLSTAIIPQLLSSGQVTVPSYNRAALEPGILHVGVGNFHRGHMATYLDDLFEQDFESNKAWGIVGASIYDSKAKRDALEQQDWMQTLMERDADYVNAKLICSMIDYVEYDEQLQNLQECLKNPQTKIVSLTITEGGYFLDDGAFDPTHPDIQHDILNPDSPKTIFGLIVKTLKERKDSGKEPFTVLSCDNIPKNGDVVKAVVTGLAKLMTANEDPQVAKWIEENVAFPNSMVDRIVPATSKHMKEFCRQEFGIDDELPIFCEPFRQWVLEDNFPQGRPKLELLDGISFVEDVKPYEWMKLRILNGGHASLCYPSALLDVEFVHDSMAHPTIGPFLDCLERQEMIPAVPPVPNTDLHEYWNIIAKRFSNPTIEDTIYRNCWDGASRQPKFIVPIIKDSIAAGRSVEGLALVSAMWCRYCQGKTESGKTIEPNDPQWDRLSKLAHQAKTDPMAWLGMHDVYGDVGHEPVLVKAFTEALEVVEKKGVEAAMKKYIAKSTKKVFNETTTEAELVLN